MLGKGVALMAALIATFFVSLAVSMRMALRAGEVSVPELAGVTVNDATAALADLGLTLRVDDAGRPDVRVPAEDGDEPVDREAIKLDVADARKVSGGNACSCFGGPRRHVATIHRLDDLRGKQCLELLDRCIGVSEIGEDIAAAADDLQGFM